MKKTFSGMLRRVALARIDISEELSVTIFRVTRIGETGTTLVILHSHCRENLTSYLAPPSSGSKIISARN
jgi:hypothetical protein